MAGSLVTNDNGMTLGNLINTTLESSSDISFLVGYFYFSGFAELYKNIGDRKMRILVGLDIDVDIHNFIREYEKITKINRKSRQKDRTNYYEQLVKLFRTDFFEDPDKQEAFRIFYNKIQNGTLEIRKTAEPNHSKLYLFQAMNQNDPTLPGHMIIGSSNLSISGLKNQNELNVIFHDCDYNEGKELFDRLWASATKIADLETLSEFNEKVIKHIWLDKTPSPYAMYLRVLNEYFSSYTADDNFRTPKQLAGYMDLAYQIDAIKAALGIIKRHNGVIVADVVGLGKSIIASSVAANLNLPVIIITPPHLEKQWIDYAQTFGFLHHAHVFTSGKIQNALDKFGNDNQQYLIIIDEAHRYRNDSNADYARLEALCTNNKVVLLTATPYNNKPKDVYNLVKLFQIPNKSTLKNVDNFGRRFEDLIARYNKAYAAARKAQSATAEKTFIKESKAIAKAIQNIISPLVIRRSRTDLQSIKRYKKDLAAQHIEFAKFNDPENLEYNIDEIKDIYLRTLDAICPKDEENNTPNTYNAARYQPLAYVKPEYKDKVIRQLEEEGLDSEFMDRAQKQLAKFMRQLLTQRFESSIWAFKTSLDSMIKNSENILRWIEHRQKIPVFKRGNLPDIEELKETSYDTLFGADEELEKQIAVLKEKGLFELEYEYIRPEFEQDVEADIRLLKQIRYDWFESGRVTSDPKITAFISEVSKQLNSDPQRKIVVFTGYADTAKYLNRELTKHKLPVFCYTAADASDANKRIIRQNFDAGVPSNEQCDDYKILVATDAISEGYNLHRAGTIFNYDIPYNPTRVIQRVGRINRINKKVFNELHIYNFFPSYIGEKNINVKRISTIKMRMINMIMGNDEKILTDDEELFFTQYNDKLRKIEQGNEQKSWDTDFYNELDEARTNNTPEYQEALAINPRSRIQRTDQKRKCVIVYGKHGDESIFQMAFDGNTASTIVSAEDALPLFKAKKGEISTPVSPEFMKIYQNILNGIFHGADGGLNSQQGKAKAKVLAWRNDPQNHQYDEYLRLLEKAIELNALPNYKLINKSKTPAQLSQQITQKYLEKKEFVADQIDSEPENVILAEELR